MPPKMRGPGGSDTSDDTTTTEEDDKQQNTTNTTTDSTSTSDTDSTPTSDLGDTSGVPTTGAAGGQDTTVDDSQDTPTDTTDTTDPTNPTGTVGGSGGVPTPGGSQDTTAGGTGSPTDMTDRSTDTDTTSGTPTGSGGTGSSRTGPDIETGGGGDLDRDIGGMNDSRNISPTPTDDPSPRLRDDDDDLQTFDPQESSAGQGLEKHGSREAVTYRSTGTTTVRQQAQRIEEAFLKRNPQYSAEDIAVLDTQEGPGFRPEIRLTQTGAAVAAAEQLRQQDRIQEGAVGVSGTTVTVDTGLVDPAAGTTRSFAGRDRAAPTLSVDIGDGAGTVRRPETPQPAQGVDRRAQPISPGGSPVQRDATEEFGDIDWSFGYGDPRKDEVETAIDETAERVQRAGRSAADWIFRPEGPGGQSAGEEILRAAGRPELARGYERNLENVGRGLVAGTTAIVNVPGMVGGVLEGVEATKYYGENVAEGEGSRVNRQFLEEGGRIYDAAASNPYRTAGMLGGALVASTGIMRAAREVGPRTGLASRVAIQPGEEAAGYGGYYLASAASGTRTAERLFPNKEPLIFSEEAAIRAASAATSRARQAVRGSELERFAKSTRGQADLTGVNRVEIADTEATSELSQAEAQRQQVSQAAYEASEIGSGPATTTRSNVKAGINEQGAFVGSYTRASDPAFGGSGKFSLTRGERDFSAAVRRARESPAGRLERAQRPQARVETDTPRRYETNIAEGVSTQPATTTDTMARAQQRAEAATKPLADVSETAATRQDARIGAESMLGTRTELDTELDTLSETAVDVEARAEARTEGETEAETEAEVFSEIRREFERRQELKREQEIAAETEPRERIETEPNRPAEREGRQFDYDFDTGGGDTGTGELDIGTGYLAEFFTAAAVGPGPRRAPSESVLEDADTLTEQRPTRTMLSGTEAEKEAIDETIEAFTFGDLDADGDGGWF
jgi:hypothetical protein